MRSGADQKTESDAGQTPGKGLVSLRARQREAARLHVLGWSNKRIGAELGYAVATVSQWLRLALVRDYIRLLEAVRERGALAVYDQLQREYLPEAVATEVDIMRKDEARDADRLNAAQDILDRSGLPKVSRQQLGRAGPSLIQINITEAQARAFAKVDEEAGKPQVNDITWEIVPDDDA
jgi:hypothetical protein